MFVGTLLGTWFRFELPVHLPGPDDRISRCATFVVAVVPAGIIASHSHSFGDRTPASSSGSMFDRILAFRVMILGTFTVVAQCQELKQ